MTAPSTLPTPVPSTLEPTAHLALEAYHTELGSHRDVSIAAIHRAETATCSAQRQGAALHIQRALHPAFRHLHRGQPSDASAINRDTGLLFNTLHYCETLFINLRLIDYKTFD